MADPYILEPLDTDPEAIFSDFAEFVRSFYPDWNPSEAQLDIIIARFFSQQAATVADMASRVQRSIFRYLGSNLENIPPLPGSAASATISFHVTDGLAHTLEIGAEVGLRDDSGDLMIFRTIDDMTFSAGTEWPSVTAQADELGSFGNGLTGAVEVMELVDWIDSAEVVGASSGGSDPEEDEIYFNRLTANLAIPRRPQLAEDLVTMAQNVPGVWRAAAIDNFHDLGGGSYSTDMEDSVAISALDVNGNGVVDPVRSNLIAYIQANLRQNFVVTYVDPTYNEIWVAYTAHTYKGYDADSVMGEIDAALAHYLHPANFGLIPGNSQDRSWHLTQTLRYLELTTVVENVRSVDYVDDLLFRVYPGGMSKLDKTLSGVFPVTTYGVGGIRSVIVP